MSKVAIAYLRARTHTHTHTYTHIHTNTDTQLPFTHSCQSWQRHHVLLWRMQIVAGLEPENTNLFFQMLGRACKMDNGATAVQVTLGDTLGPCLALF